MVNRTESFALNTEEKDTTLDGRESIRDQSKLQLDNLNKEKLANINNSEFLAVSKETRLKYISKNSIDSNQLLDSLKQNNTVDIAFTFTFNGVYNKDLYLKTTAGQVLPSQVTEVQSNGVTYTRSTLEGEFFSKNNKRLTIHEGTKISISKSRDITQLQEKNTLALDVYMDQNKDQEENREVIQGAINRGIDVSFALNIFAQFSNNAAKLEDAFTEFDRVRGVYGVGKQMVDGKYSDEITLGMLSKFKTDSWKAEAEKMGYTQEKIASYETNNLSRQAFLEKAMLIGEEIEQQYGIPQMVVVGQAMLESGDGQSLLAQKGNNVFGIKAMPGEESINMETGEYRNGSYGIENADFRRFDSLEESFHAYARLLTKASRYRGAFSSKNNPEQFLAKINSAGYSTTPTNTYVSSVKSRLSQYGLSLRG